MTRCALEKLGSFDDRRCSLLEFPKVELDSARREESTNSDPK